MRMMFPIVPPEGLDLPAVDITVVEHLDAAPNLPAYLMIAVIVVVGVSVVIAFTFSSSRALAVSGGAKILAAVMGVALIGLGVGERAVGEDEMPADNITLDSASIAALESHDLYERTDSGDEPYSHFTDLPIDQQYHTDLGHDWGAMHDRIHNVGDSEWTKVDRPYSANSFKQAVNTPCKYTLLSSETDYFAWKRDEHAGLVDQVNTYRLECLEWYAPGGGDS